MQKKILLVLFLGSFLTLTGFVGWSWRKKSTEHWASYSPVLLRKTWESRHFVPISSDANFRTSIQSKLQPAISSSLVPPERLPHLAAFIDHFLHAYSDDSFARFWEFRAPLKGTELTGRGRSSATAFIELAMDHKTIPREIVRPQDARQLYNHLWNAARGYLAAENLPGGSANPMSNAWCTECLAEFSLEDMIVSKPEPEGRDPRLNPAPILGTLRRRPNIGIYAYGERLRPPEDESPDSDLYVEIMIKTRNGRVHPAALIARWSGTAGCYFPVSMGHPLTSSDRVKLIF